MNGAFEKLADAIANSHKAFDLANLDWNIVKEGFADLKARLEKLENAGQQHNP